MSSHFQWVRIRNERRQESLVDIRDIHKFCAKYWRAKSAVMREVLCAEVRKAINTQTTHFEVCGTMFSLS